MAVKMMKNEDLLIDLHIGSMIKEVAFKKQVSAKKIADAINRYDRNADKIFKLNDMYMEDVQIISHLLMCNFLKIISDKYLSHIPFTGNILTQENFSIILDMQSKCFQIKKKNTKKEDFEIHIGSYIKEVAKKNGIREQQIADQMGCSQGLISYIYKQKTMKIKQLIKVSMALNYNLITEVYLSKMDIIFFYHLFDDCIIELNTNKNIQGEEQNYRIFSIHFNSRNAEE